ncbi:hypothetical protein CBL_03218 [Carabus blaptoides fortunei]
MHQSTQNVRTVGKSAVERKRTNERERMDGQETIRKSEHGNRERKKMEAQTSIAIIRSSSNRTVEPPYLRTRPGNKLNTDGNCSFSSCFLACIILLQCAEMFRVVLKLQAILH